MASTTGSGEVAEGTEGNGHGGSTDVLIVGAGPVGLTLANYLGMHGVRTRVIEQRDVLIDYPRGVGVDDESLRAFQAIGLIDRILPHTTPNQVMRFVNGKGRTLAVIAPTEQPFGWPRRSGFIQPLVDEQLLVGLDRFDEVEVLWSHTLDSLATGADGVTATVIGPNGKQEIVRARYAVGCDGGRSTTRRLIGTSFEGTTSATRWVVIDLRNDPLGTPNVTVGADPVRPFVSVSLAHGVRRFEFMIHDDEPDEMVEDPDFLAELLKPHIPYPSQIDVIRKRVYTHHSRIAGSFRDGPVFIAGDAAHLMPVWQGQGYNSGIRDAVNLGWKLALVVRGGAGDALLDSYDPERRDHARAMIDLSTLVGKWVSPTSNRVAAVRDVVLRVVAAIPTFKQYLVEMRFKPMPRYTRGAITELYAADEGVVGRQFIQPRVDTRTERGVPLDAVTGPWFSVLCWNNDPRAVLGEEADRWLGLGARLVELRPQPQLHWPGADHDDVQVVGDSSGALKRWFDGQNSSVLFLRPDRFVAAACVAQHAPETSRALSEALALIDGGDHVRRAELHVAQPTP
jgi:3-(3-hydroxy-phenyl)propionate hydroxylase